MSERNEKAELQTYPRLFFTSIPLFTSDLDALCSKGDGSIVDHIE
jgi:hypothetical protein